MIFTFNEEFDELNWQDHPVHVTCVENLLRVHAEGWHTLSLTKKVAKSLIESGVLSPNGLNILNFLVLERRAILMGQARSAPFVGYCTFSDESNENIDDRYLPVPLTSFQNLDNIFRTILLVENTHRDGRFYMSLVDRYAKQYLSGATTKFELAMGGGNTTAEELERLENDSARPIFCVVDSDRTSPNGAIGNTANRVRKKKNNDRGLSVIEVLPIRSLEGFIPPNSVLETLTDDHPAVDYFNKAQSARTPGRVSANGSSDLWHYLSPKKAIKIGHVRKSSGHFRKSLENFLLSLGVEVPEIVARSSERDDEILYQAPIGDFVLNWIDHCSNDEEFGVRAIDDCLRCPLLCQLLAKLSAFGLCQFRSAAYVS